MTGAESQHDTGEPHAPAEAQPHNMQGISYCFALDHLAGEDHTIPRPAHDEYWRAYRPSFWPAPLLSWTAVNPHILEPVHHTFRPNPDLDPTKIHADQSAGPGAADLWLFRRILARLNFAASNYPSDITLVNWPQMDYFDGLVFDVAAEDTDRHLETAKQLSLSLRTGCRLKRRAKMAASAFPVCGCVPMLSGRMTGCRRSRTFANRAGSARCIRS